MPQREFARKSGVAQSTIMRIENLDQNVTLATLEQLCKVFRVDVAELFPAMQSPRVYPLSGESQQAIIHEQRVSPSAEKGPSATNRKPAKTQSTPAKPVSRKPKKSGPATPGA